MNLITRSKKICRLGKSFKFFGIGTIHLSVDLQKALHVLASDSTRSSYPGTTIHSIIQLEAPFTK